MAGIYALANGMNVQENANLDIQDSMATEAILLAPILLDLNQSYTTTVAEDTYNYNTATANSALPDDTYPSNPQEGTGPHMVAIAAEDNVQTEVDQNDWDLSSSNLSNITNTLESTVEYLGSNLDSVFQLESPVITLLQQVNSLIMEV